MMIVIYMLYLHIDNKHVLNLNLNPSQYDDTLFSFALFSCLK